jgi:protein-L-isoaspartate(D-aspartate) O-methyltransferase
VALMTEALDLQGGERVLEIGTGSGYAAAVLAEIAAEVYTIERIGELAEKAASTLAALGYRNVHVVHADGTRGWAAAVAEVQERAMSAMASQIFAFSSCFVTRPPGVQSDP